MAKFEFIEAWYNPKRRHSSLGYISPVDREGAEPGGFFFVPKVAILIDGGFFLKRYPWCYGKRRPAAKVAKDMHEMALKHLGGLTSKCPKPK